MRIKGGLLICLVFVIGCSVKPITKQTQTPPSQTKNTHPPVELPAEETNKISAIHVLYPAFDSYSVDVQNLIKMDIQAVNFLSNGNTLAANQLYEEALDYITEYEERRIDNSKEYKHIKNKIHVGFREFLKSEGIEINETASELLQDDLDLSKDEVEGTPSDYVSSFGTFPYVRNSRVERWLDAYKGARYKSVIQRYINRSGRYLPMIMEKVREHGLPEEVAYLAFIESGYNPNAYSRAHAVGMWQFIAATGRKYGLKINYYIDERRNPEKSTDASFRHMKDLYKLWGDWNLVMANYNVSEGRLKREIRRSKTRDYWKLRGLPRETRNFVPKFLAAVSIMRDPVAFGFKPSTLKPIEYDNVKITEPASFDVIAKAAGVRVERVKELNPELRSWITPLDSKEYYLKIPKGSAERFAVEFPKIPKNEYITSLTHRLRRGETVGRLSRQYGVSVRDIMAANSISNPRRLQIGQELVIPMAPSKIRGQYANAASSRSTSARRGPVKPIDFDKRSKVTYKVKKNDTLWDISQLYGVNVKNLRDWNGMGRRSSRIYPGRELVVWMPPSANDTQVTVSPPAPPSPTHTVSSSTDTKTEYKVRRGDTLSGISLRFKVDVSEIYAWNDLNRRSVIYPGQRITLYVGQEYIDDEKNVDEIDGTLVYTVRRGDSLWDIAKKFDTTVRTIKSLNNKIGSRIYPGDKVIVPSSSKQQ